MLPSFFGRHLLMDYSFRTAVISLVETPHFQPEGYLKSDGQSSGAFGIKIPILQGFLSLLSLFGLTPMVVCELGMAPSETHTDTAQRNRNLSDDHHVVLLDVLDRISAREPFKKQLTDMERIALAAYATGPTNHVTITSTLDRAAFRGAFSALKKQYLRRRRRPLIYVGSVADGRGNGGSHAHLLLWGYIEKKWLQPAADAVGLGRIKFTPILDKPPKDTLYLSAYPFSQHQPIFNSDKHLSHHELPKSAHRYIRPWVSTLQESKPELLAAINIARSPVVPDDQIVAGVHVFIRGIEVYTAASRDTSSATLEDC